MHSIQIGHSETVLTELEQRLGRLVGLDQLDTFTYWRTLNVWSSATVTYEYSSSCDAKKQDLGVDPVVGKSVWKPQLLKTAYCSDDMLSQARPRHAAA